MFFIRFLCRWSRWRDMLLHRFAFVRVWFLEDVAFLSFGCLWVSWGVPWNLLRLIFGRFGTDFQNYPGDFGSQFEDHLGRRSLESFLTQCWRDGGCIDASLFLFGSLKMSFYVPFGSPAILERPLSCLACQVGVLSVLTWKLGKSLWVHWCALRVCRACLGPLGLSCRVSETISMISITF